MTTHLQSRRRFFYGWYIVGVAILVNIAGTFAFSSTLSIFLKPITEELGVTRGAFSLIRTFEIGIAAMIVPLLGPWLDRHGGRGILVIGVLMEGTGLLLSSQVHSFWQFVLVRCSLVIAGEALLGSLVINVTIAQWFVRNRGRGIVVCPSRLARHLGGIRHHRAYSGGGAGADLCT
jgi:MFS family permease